MWARLPVDGSWESWVGLRRSLSGLYCASLDAMDETRQASVPTICGVANMKIYRLQREVLYVVYRSLLGRKTAGGTFLKFGFLEKEDPAMCCRKRTSI